ncbi:DUF4145 domain-containing protein [Pseudomonas alliivorans]|nr:DUF4145 domain-containing protein [Pseudomonas alliivorans]MEE4817770.1 DUF4145 domain-containing protein [Pseudomonas alliivorans]MEE4834252.1 DUF4145 domain-containing protein [Pseudomonas alliivorans]MEE4924694.1 DUF4145 domain-containing protein [Pseudomonas alliivorans]
MKQITPSIAATAFSCPYCGAFANQTWCSLLSEAKPLDHPTPFIVGPGGSADLDLSEVDNEEERRILVEWADKMATGMVLLEDLHSRPGPLKRIENLNLSTCFNCKKHAIWVYDRIVHPVVGSGPVCNPDMSDDIRRDYEEACAILNQSPRGAAALARLCIQKLCKELGKAGKNINEDIGSLVSDGLDKRIQQALDVVRVIGNNAVHPGQIDLRDDKATAETLLSLLNLIVDRLISEPKHIEELYSKLPEGVLKGIEDRDKK